MLTFYLLFFLLLFMFVVAQSVQPQQLQQSAAAARGWRFVPDTILPGSRRGTPVGPGKDTHGTLRPDQREGRGWPIKIRQLSKQCRNTPERR